MKLHDLAGLVPFVPLFDAVRTKLNNTYVMYENSWFMCSIADHTDCEEEGVIYEYNKGSDWIFLMGISGNKSLNTLVDIITEPEWPEAGYYFYNSKTYQIKYSRGQIFKAGLSPEQFILSCDSAPCGISTYLKVLNAISSNSIIYPDIGTAIELLLTSPNTTIPISNNLLVGAHPYVNGPVLYYENTNIGTIKDNRVKLSTNNHKFEEYLTHLGVAFTT